MCSKTVLFLVKQFLIIQLSQSWDTHLLYYLHYHDTLAYIIYAVDNTFVSTLNHLNIPNPKRVYHKYLVSYSMTNISALIVIIASILNAVDKPSSDSVWQVSYTPIFVPFIWLIPAKLYNNEFARFKICSQNIGNDEIKSSIAVTFRSLYHFQNTLAMASIMSVVIFVYLIINNKYSSIFTPLAIIQTVFPCVILTSIIS